MSILSRLFGSRSQDAEPVETGPCPHTQLVPRWANAEDMGNAEKTSEYRCAACEAAFTPEEGRALRAQ